MGIKKMNELKIEKFWKIQFEGTLKEIFRKMDTYINQNKKIIFLKNKKSQTIQKYTKKIILLNLIVFLISPYINYIYFNTFNPVWAKLFLSLNIYNVLFSFSVGAFFCGILNFFILLNLKKDLKEINSNIFQTIQSEAEDLHGLFLYLKVEQKKSLEKLLFLLKRKTKFTQLFFKTIYYHLLKKYNVENVNHIIENINNREWHIGNIYIIAKETQNIGFNFVVKKLFFEEFYKK